MLNAAFDVGILFELPLNLSRIQLYFDRVYIMFILLDVTLLSQKECL